MTFKQTYMKTLDMIHYGNTNHMQSIQKLEKGFEVPIKDIFNIALCIDHVSGEPQDLAELAEVV